MSITLENERLKNEVYELRRLLSMQDNVISSDTSRDDVILQLHEDLDGQERVEALEKEIIRAKDAVDSEYLLVHIRYLSFLCYFFRFRYISTRVIR